ncbi:uncharacterized protein BDZ83DRAFT_224182 [Colletotrichum acutatum]|uniref:Uncharacterized protein n=1 Tax=Glomerella acutata TaxID=27357 RepID=A0AAD8URV4_GLOAC|nr:uncharacterized protein BDZ83DRAFT_224182 [Colletotrichum acutatum]KAK1727265.1 hypothetical protein BDZ83DRAFT_224182 [Colletotrichum acutatum]
MAIEKRGGEGISELVDRRADFPRVSAEYGIWKTIQNSSPSSFNQDPSTSILQVTWDDSQTQNVFCHPRTSPAAKVQSRYLSKPPLRPRLTSHCGPEPGVFVTLHANAAAHAYFVADSQIVHSMRALKVGVEPSR